MGLFPSARHDGSPWHDGDASRAKVSGRAMPCRGALLQVRGDWAFYKAVFDFPAWSQKQICWRCEAGRGTEHDFRDCGLSASWRSTRLSGVEFLARQRHSGVTPSALFQSPGFKVEYCIVDWLHTVDLGVAADAMGHLFDEICPLLVPAACKGAV